MNALPQTDRYELLDLAHIASAPTFRELADIAAAETDPGARYVIRDVVTGAYYNPALEPGRAIRQFSVLAPPNRKPQVGEKWLHRTLGEVEVVDTSNYRPEKATWLVVRRLDGVDGLRRSVDPADLIGRAE